jgi:hypothetical protein
MMPRALIASMNSRELTELMAFDELEPLGHRGTGAQLGYMASAMYNHWRGDDAPPGEIRDFQPATLAHAAEWSEQEAEQAHDPGAAMVQHFMRRKINDGDE